MIADNTLNIAETLEKIASEANSTRADMETVYGHLKQAGKYCDSLILQEMRWFFTELGLDRFYFETTPPVVVAQHIESLYAGKILAEKGTLSVNQSFETKQDENILVACFDRREITHQVERRIDEFHADCCIRSYRSLGSADPLSNTHFRLYYIIPTEAGKSANETTSSDIGRIGDKNLLVAMSDRQRNRYQKIVDEAARSNGPVFAFVERERRRIMNILVAYRRGTSHSYFSAIFDLLYSYNISCERSYVEQFSNGIVLYSIHIPLSTPQKILDNLKEDMSLLYALPRTSLTPLFRAGKLTAQEVTYAYAALRFACQFLARYQEAYASLAPAFKDDAVKLGLLNEMRHRLSKDTYTQERVTETIQKFPEMIKHLYKEFHNNHFVPSNEKNKTYDVESWEALRRLIFKSASTQIDLDVLCAFLDFNRYVAATNFYHSRKLALAFRLNPSFIQDIDYPKSPYAVFMVVGSEFRGFHVRFRNIARGGVRIIRSANHQAFVHNSDMLFHECYHLAYTQQQKNKDIPEGGSKGALLLSFEHQTKGEVAFKKYVDALLDLISNDDDKEQELLFLGPDEGTAELMDWAATHAESRGYPFWKSFTTGKSQRMGGIPHDIYGMTTHSVHQYVLCILEKMGLSETEITKVQTGGPDGDLGSNEILVSNDKTIAIVDGSGVVYDPKGIHRETLVGLAKSRRAVEYFDTTKLSADGFKVLVGDTDVALPDGTMVENGLVFRNSFHLSKWFAADLFVPCGGRPNSVHINNVEKLFDEEGQPKFKYVVEGANLFLSPEARIVLEQAGVIVIKDASANKGGVTSSSREVLASLVLSDERFSRLMAVRESETSDFYERYVREVKASIGQNATLEFDCIWDARKKSGSTGTRLSERISQKINQLTDALIESDISHDEALQKAVLKEVVPSSLQKEVGLETIIERLPAAYLQAMFASHLAGRYVYEVGLDASEIQFVQFLKRI